jgi:hypothetical protein
MHWTPRTILILMFLPSFLLSTWVLSLSAHIRQAYATSPALYDRGSSAQCRVVTPVKFQATDPSEPPKVGEDVVPDFEEAWDVAYGKAKDKVGSNCRFLSVARDACNAL